jgi:hypothetical protein
MFGPWLGLRLKLGYVLARERRQGEQDTIRQSKRIRQGKTITTRHDKIKTTAMATATAAATAKDKDKRRKTRQKIGQDKGKNKRQDQTRHEQSKI